MNKEFEKILERLEEKKSIIPVNRLLDNIIKDKTKELGQLIAYDKAIEIVKHGGVDDDVCEWHCDMYGRCHTECHILADNDPLEYTYCPYCGKKIKVGGENDNSNSF